MEFKNIKELSNNDLQIYSQELEDEFESTKTKIDNLCKYLESIDREYEKLTNEVNNRLSEQNGD